MSKEPIKHPPKLISALPELLKKNVLPKQLSQKTSYHQKRIVFHFQPQVTSILCNKHEFSLSIFFYDICSLLTVKSFGFGSNPYNSCILLLNFFTPTLFNLSLLYKLTCWTLIQKVHYHNCSNRLSAYNFNSFSLPLFWVLFHLSFTILVHYRLLILFRLSKWSCYLQT